MAADESVPGAVIDEDLRPHAEACAYLWARTRRTGRSTPSRRARDAMSAAQAAMTSMQDMHRAIS